VYNIAFVEDDPNQVELFKEYLTQYQAQTGQRIKPRFFSDGEDILAAMPVCLDIIFLDIMMRNVDGMTAAAKIRESDKNVIMIFITNMSQFAIKGYSVGALNFLLKPVSYFAFAEELRRALEKLENKRPMHLAAHVAGGIVRLEASEMHKIFMHAKSVVAEDYLPMKEMEQKLSGHLFARCNNCYLVNLEHVKGIVDGFCLVGEERLAISRARKKPFMEALAAYLGEKL
jgi:DNA-binding LytR/AlgR family response regulator